MSNSVPAFMAGRGTLLLAWMAAILAAAGAGCSRKPIDNPYNRQLCAKHMQFIYHAINFYSGEHNLNYPPDLGALFKTTHVSPDVFLCPSNATKLPDGMHSMSVDQVADWIAKNSDYIYTGAGLTRSADPAAVVLYEHDNDHDGVGINVLYADGQVDFLSLDEARKAIARSDQIRGKFTPVAP